MNADGVCSSKVPGVNERCDAELAVGTGWQQTARHKSIVPHALHMTGAERTPTLATKALAEQKLLSER